MNRTALTTTLIVLGIAAVVAYLTLFTVYQTQQALVLEFGKAKREIKDPGLHYKIPFIQNVEYFDKRILDIDTAAQEVIASDKKRLVVDAFARYRITDPLMFFQSVRDERIANSRIGALLEASLRRVLGGASFQAVVRDKREALMRTILSQVNQEAKEFGVEIVDVRIKRVDLPEANMQAIYRRMQTERQREAAEFRAEGEGASRRIRGTADREVTVIKADATGESERIRGDGDAERNRVYAEAFNKDPEFFGFYRSMQAYEASLQAGDTRMLLSPDSEFFRYFNDAAGQAAPGAKPGEHPTTPSDQKPTPEAATPPAAEPRAALDNGSGSAPETASGQSGEPTPPAQ
jgi:membrane protease subunit HflC